MLKYLKLFEEFITEKKPKGAPDFHHSDAPDAEGRFRDLSPKKLAAWLIKTRKKDLKRISGSLTQQVVFNRKSDPKYADKMEKTRIEVYKQLGRDDLLNKDESVQFVNEGIDFQAILLKDAMLKYNIQPTGGIPRTLQFAGKGYMKAPKGTFLIGLPGGLFAVNLKKKFAVQLTSGSRAYLDAQDKLKDNEVGGTNMAPEYREWKKYLNESVVTEGKLKISGPAYDLWDEKEVQRKLRGVKIKIVGDIGGVATIKGDDKELQKVKDILGLNEAAKHEDYLNKVNFLLAGEKLEGLTGKNNKRIYGEINDVCLEKLYNSFYAKGDYGKVLEVNSDLPLIYYGGNSKEGLDFIKRYNISENVMYNSPKAMKVSGNKSKFYKMFEDTDFIPKAVYKKEDAKDLQFPVIAKPDDGHSGLGIEIFDTYEDLEKSKGKFENYSEAKDLDKEFRVLLMNEEPVLVHERVSLNENEIKDKDADEQTEFTYVDQDMNKLDFMNEVNNICKTIREKLKLGLWSIDLMIDKSGNCWVAEINSASGMAADKMARVYVKVYEDFYGKELPQEFKTYLNEEYIQPIYKINLKENAAQIKKSKCCVNYQNIIDGKEFIL